MVITMKQSRIAGLIFIAGVYAIAIIIGAVVFIALPNEHIFLRILIGDIIATTFVFLMGLIVKNTTVYDPYWSVAPIVICTGLAIKIGRVEPGLILLLVAVWYWGVRLTCNWIYTFQNLATQDWRYDKFKAQFPRAFPIISYLGINMVPTLWVFLCLMPGIVFIQDSTFNLITLLGFIVCVSATMLQLFADIQMQRFRRKNTGSRLLIREGLWKHSRHPNYLGEILMWWGLYIIMLSSAPQMWWLIIGPIVNTCLFLIISIPLADKRNRQVRIGFDDYYRETNALLPFKIKKSS